MCHNVVEDVSHFHSECDALEKINGRKSLRATMMNDFNENFVMEVLNSVKGIMKLYKLKRGCK